MTVAYVGIGSNVGDRIGFCRAAVDQLDGEPNVRVTATSSLYETAPIGGPPQRSFVNMAARLETDVGPRDLLVICQEIERRIGREPSDIRWGPRVVDIDILLFGDTKISEEDLEIPHPRLQQRRFALVPLLEIDPDLTDPWGGRYADWIDEAQGKVEVLEPF